MQWILQFLQHREEKSPAKTPMDPEEAAAAAAVAAAIGATGSKAVSPAVVFGIELELAALTGSRLLAPAMQRPAGEGSCSPAQCSAGMLCAQLTVRALSCQASMLCGPAFQARLASRLPACS